MQTASTPRTPKHSPARSLALLPVAKLVGTSLVEFLTLLLPDHRSLIPVHPSTQEVAFGIRTEHNARNVTGVLALCLVRLSHCKSGSVATRSAQSSGKRSARQPCPDVDGNVRPTPNLPTCHILLLLQLCKEHGINKDGILEDFATQVRPCTCCAVHS